MAGRTEKLVAVYFVHVGDEDAVSTLHRCVVAEASEKRLHVLRDPEAEGLVCGVSDPCLDLKFVALGKTFEARDADLSAPRPQAKGVEMVDAVGDPEPLDQRPEADAAGDDENQRTVAEILQHAAKPAQELVDSQGVTVFLEHPVEKDRKLVDHEEYGFVVMSAFVKQVLPVATPVYGIQS